MKYDRTLANMFLGVYQIVLDSDAPEFGGFQRNAPGTRFFTTDFAWNNRKNFVQVYVPCRTAIVLALETTL